MSISTIEKEEKLSAVAWVNNRWAFFVVLTIFVINVIAALGILLRNENLSILLIICFVVAIILLSYPYLHYRQQGGYIKRIPPRFYTEKPFFSKK